MRSFILFITLIFCVKSHGNSETESIMWTVKWKPDGTHFVVGGSNTLKLFDKDGQLVKSILPEYDGPQPTVTDVEWHKTKNILAISSQNGDVNGILNLGSNTFIAFKGSHTRGIEWSPDYKYVSQSSPGDGYLRIWNLDGTLANKYPRYGVSKGLTGHTWDTKNSMIVTIGNRITFHDAKAKAYKQIHHRPDGEPLLLLLGIDWHPTKNKFVISDYGNEVEDPAIQVWTKDGRLLKSIIEKGGAEFRNVEWKPDGTAFASSSHSLFIWSEDGEKLHEGLTDDMLWGLDWHPDGTKIITSSEEGRVMIWNSKANLLKTIPVFGK